MSGNAVIPVLQGPAGPAGPAGPPGPAGPNYISVTQANLFSDGQVVYFDGTNWQLAKADSGLTLGIGIVSNATPATFDVVYVGPVSGFVGLTSGDYYFLSDTIAGSLTSTAPTTAGSYSQPILFATSATDGLAMQYRPSQVASATGAIARFGRVAVVDDVNGDDAAASVNGLPYKTVNAAVTDIGGAAGTVWILPGTYSVTPFTIPNNCSIRGLSLQTVVLQCLNVVAPTTLITMGTNTRLEDVSIKLTSSDATSDLVGIEFPGTTAQNAKLRTAVLTVDNSSVAVGSTTNVYGVYFSGTNPAATAQTFSFNALKGSTINVFSNGAGAKRGIYQDAASQVSTRDMNVYVAAPQNSASTGTYIGVHSNDATNTGQIQLRATSIGGAPDAGSYTGSDVLQSFPTTSTANAGIQIGPGTNLNTSTAGGGPFYSFVTPSVILYGLRGNVPNNNGYYWPGTQTTADANQVYFRFQQPTLVFGLAMSLRSASVTGNITVVVEKSTDNGATWTVTPLTVNFTGADKIKADTGHSVRFAAGDLISVSTQAPTPPGAGSAADATIQFDLF